MRLFAVCLAIAVSSQPSLYPATSSNSPPQTYTTITSEYSWKAVSLPTKYYCPLDSETLTLSGCKMRCIVNGNCTEICFTSPNRSCDIVFAETATNCTTTAKQMCFSLTRIAGTTTPRIRRWDSKKKIAMSKEGFSYNTLWYIAIVPVILALGGVSFGGYRHLKSRGVVKDSSDALQLHGVTRLLTKHVIRFRKKTGVAGRLSTKAKHRVLADIRKEMRDSIGKTDVQPLYAGKRPLHMRSAKFLDGGKNSLPSDGLPPDVCKRLGKKHSTKSDGGKNSLPSDGLPSDVCKRLGKKHLTKSGGGKNSLPSDGLPPDVCKRFGKKHSTKLVVFGNDVWSDGVSQLDVIKPLVGMDSTMLESISLQTDPSQNFKLTKKATTSMPGLHAARFNQVPRAESGFLISKVASSNATMPVNSATVLSSGTLLPPSADLTGPISDTRITGGKRFKRRRPVFARFIDPVASTTRKTKFNRMRE